VDHSWIQKLEKGGYEGLGDQLGPEAKPQVGVKGQSSLNLKAFSQQTTEFLLKYFVVLQYFKIMFTQCIWMKTHICPPVYDWKVAIT